MYISTCPSIIVCSCLSYSRWRSHDDASYEYGDVGDKLLLQNLDSFLVVGRQQCHASYRIMGKVFQQGVEVFELFHI